MGLELSHSGNSQSPCLCDGFRDGQIKDLTNELLNQSNPYPHKSTTQSVMAPSKVGMK